MTFMNPAMLWGFLAVVPLAAVYLLKVKPRKKLTSVWFLWNEVLLENKTSSLFRRFRDLLSFLLMLLIFCAVVLAMAQPRLDYKGAGKDLVIVIDNSASMNAMDGDKTRLEMACDTAREILKGIDLDRQVILMTANGELRYVVNRTSNQRVLIEGVNRVKSTSLSFSRDRLKSVMSEDGEAENRVILISDACFEGADELPGIELFKVGSESGNIGIASFDLLRLPGKDHRLGLFFQLASSFKKEQTVDVYLRRLHEAKAMTVDRKSDIDKISQVIKVCAVTVKPGLNEAETFIVDDDSPGDWVLTLNNDDALALDNYAFGVVSKFRPIRASLEGDDSERFLANCVNAFSVGRGLMTLVSEGADVLICKGVESKSSAANRIIFQPKGKSLFWKSLSPMKVEAERAQVLIEGHPAIRFTDVANLHFVGQQKIGLPDNALVLAESSDGNPLIYKAVANGKKAYVINMDPVYSEFFLNAYFPVLVFGMMQDLTGRVDEHRFCYKTGDRVTLNRAKVGEGKSVWITRPAGETSACHSEVFGPIDNVGFYALKGEKGTYTVAASLCSPIESLLNNEVKDSAKPIDKGWPMSYWLIILALCLAVIESLLYHRRKVG